MANYIKSLQDADGNTIFPQTLNKAVYNEDGKVAIPFSFGVDDNGNYGYYKDGADTVTPFNALSYEYFTSEFDNPTTFIANRPFKKLVTYYGVKTTYSLAATLNGSALTWDENVSIGSSDGSSATSGWGLSRRSITVDIPILSYIKLTKQSYNYGTISFLDDGTTNYHEFGTSDATVNTVTLQKDCGHIWIIGGVKSSYYISVTVDGVSYTTDINNIGGSSTNSTTGWGLSANVIHGTFKKGQVLSVNRQNAKYGMAIVY